MAVNSGLKVAPIVIVLLMGVLFVDSRKAIWKTLWCFAVLHAGLPVRLADAGGGSHRQAQSASEAPLWAMDNRLRIAAKSLEAQH